MCIHACKYMSHACRDKKDLTCCKCTCSNTGMIEAVWRWVYQDYRGMLQLTNLRAQGLSCIPVKLGCAPFRTIKLFLYITTHNFDLRYGSMRCSTQPSLPSGRAGCSILDSHTRGPSTLWILLLALHRAKQRLQPLLGRCIEVL